ncbi:hypothetical protein EAI_11363, partial [Harpegnathos saltator]
LSEEQRLMKTKDIFARYIIDVTGTCTIGISVDSMRDLENKFYVYGKEVSASNT